MDTASGKSALRVKQVDDASGSLGETLSETTLGISRVEALFYRVDVAGDRVAMSQDRLQNAQIRVEQAQLKLSDAMAKYPPTSDQVTRAQQELTIANNELSNAQIRAQLTTYRQYTTYLLMLPTIIDLTRDIKDYLTHTHLAADAVAFLRDVEESDVVVKAQAIVASGAHAIAQGVENAAVWLTNAGLATQIILLSALTLGAFAAAAAFGALAGQGTVSTSTSNINPKGGTYSYASPLKFLSGPLSGLTIPESGLGGGATIGSISGPLSTATVQVDLNASISKEVDAEEAGRIIGRKIAEEIRRR